MLMAVSCVVVDGIGNSCQAAGKHCRPWNVESRFRQVAEVHVQALCLLSGELASVRFLGPFGERREGFARNEEGHQAAPGRRGTAGNGLDRLSLGRVRGAADQRTMETPF
jgi:hypothetical protein